MKYKYAINKFTTGKRGRPVVPENWITGADPLRREKYYAWLKHKSQASYRNEEHNITWEQWEDMWDDDTWFKRGRGSEDLCLGRLDLSEGWSIENTEITKRIDYLQRWKRENPHIRRNYKK